MSRRRIWLIIIGILIAGVSATWAMERFVASHGVNTAAVVGFEADALPSDPASVGNPYAAENKVKAAGIQEESPEDAGVSILAIPEKEMFSVAKDEAEAVGEAAAEDVPPAEETVKSPLETDSPMAENSTEATMVSQYTCADLKNRLEAVRVEAEKYQDDPAMSQTARYAAAEYVRNLWDRELNLIYSNIHKEMDESTAEALRREEMEWIKKRDLAADKAGVKTPGTPAQSVEYVRTLASVTMERCYELLEKYGDFLEPGEEG